MDTMEVGLAYLQSRHGCCSCPGGQLSVSAALKSVGAAATDGRTGISPAGAHSEHTGQRDQEPDRPGSHVWHRATHDGIKKHSNKEEKKTLADSS